MTDKPQEPTQHTTVGCTCVICTQWRQRIYDAGRWPRPRYYNGEIFAPRRNEDA